MRLLPIALVCAGVLAFGAVANADVTANVRLTGQDDEFPDYLCVMAPFAQVRADVVPADTFPIAMGSPDLTTAREALRNAAGPASGAWFAATPLCAAHLPPELHIEHSRAVTDESGMSCSHDPGEPSSSAPPPDVPSSGGGLAPPNRVGHGASRTPHPGNPTRALSPERAPAAGDADG